MKVTEALTKRLVDLKCVAADATEDQIKAAAGVALVDGKLTHEEFVKLTSPDGAKSVLDTLKAIADGQAKLSERLEKLETAKPVEAKPVETPQRTVSGLEKLFAGAGNDGVNLDPKATEVRVKGHWERYDNTKAFARYPSTLGSKHGRAHPLAGSSIVADSKSGRLVMEPSARDRAVSGAWAKWLLTLSLRDRLPHGAKMTEHDQELVQYALHEYEFGGVIHGGRDGGDESPNSIAVNNRRLTDFEIKAILDDGTSGGLEIAPIVFDDAIIMTPLLNGEVFPLVDVQTVTRGRRVEGASMGNVTVTWGGTDGTDIPLFNTASFIAAFDTNIYVVNGAIEIGLDFLTDSPVNVLNTITAQYGQRLLKELDEVVIQGDGSTQPEGVTVATGTTSVSFGSTTATVSGYLQLLFGVTKEFKRGYATNRVAFFGNEVSYRRARGIEVGASDQRLVFEYDVESYSLLGHPYVIDDTLANTKIGFCNFAWYRMYRRLGLTIDSTMEGKTLKRLNQMLVTMRSRWGGALTHGGACALTTNAAA